MKKLFLLSFLCLILAACASTPEPSPAPKNTDKPEIAIKYTGASVLVTFSYSGDDWLFIEGVEVENSAGDTRKCIIKKPSRSARGGRVYESGVFSVADVDAFKAWLGDSPRARVVCKLPQMWEPVEVRY